MTTTPERRLRLQLGGLVQGVGFRPWSYRLALQLHLTGWVGNDVDGVCLDLEGTEADLQRFLQALQTHPPPRCRIDRLQQHWGTATGQLSDFRIAAAAAASGSHAANALASPDLAICPACLAELADPTSRRHRYPFISCTDCGPRYSLLRQLPFERAHTSLAAFPLCQDCAREYADPADRRFHAQTLSCPACGPRLRWQGKSSSTDDPVQAISAAAAALRQGRIVALQGIGGFQLLVDPGNAAAVAELRRRKGRPDKPLALLATPSWLEACCHINAEEREQWWSPAAPILLLRRREGSEQLAHLDGSVAGDTPWLGVMRAASGLHQLLLEAFGGGALVATSANRSGEPIAGDADEDGERLDQLADGVLRHDLPIVNRSDDSVLRLAAGRPLVLRLGRGLAPLAVAHAALQPDAKGAGLALGAQLKGSLALQLPQQILLSPDLGDIGSSRGSHLLEATASSWLQRHSVTAAAIACDAHPGYSSSQLAADLASHQGLPLQPVQHHHAHLLTVMAEHGLAGEQRGVAWDGSGHGDDGTLWGGEALAVSSAGYRRLARLRPFPLPGGERALREPRRAALGLLISAYGERWRERVPACGARPWLQAFKPEDLEVLEQALARDLNSPLCSSVGRLFDAVAALLGLQQICSYEAQAAMALEGLATRMVAHGASGHRPSYRLPLKCSAATGCLEWDWRPLLEQLLQDLADGGAGDRSERASGIALAFHQALAEGLADLAALVRPPEALGAGHIPDGTQPFLLSGGCFQNALLLERSVAALQARGITAVWSQQLPCNDAALAVGQLLAAPAVPITPTAPRATPHVPRRTG
jgi:hydrogenase maturation protein HypF